jgi:hypothetical protein
MPETGFNETSLENTLFQLLQTDSARTMGSGNLLVMMSLVNLMGLIDIINRRLGEGTGKEMPEAASAPGAAREGAGAEAGGGNALDPSALMGMLNHLMKNRPRAAGGPSGVEGEPEQPGDVKGAGGPAAAGNVS